MNTADLDIDKEVKEFESKRYFQLLRDFQVMRKIEKGKAKLKISLRDIGEISKYEVCIYGLADDVLTGLRAIQRLSLSDDAKSEVWRRVQDRKELLDRWFATGKSVLDKVRFTRSVKMMMKKSNLDHWL